MTVPTGNGVFGPATGQPDPSSGAASTLSRQDFAEAVLRAGGWPTTQSNVTFLVNWMQREGGTAAFNPINTTHGMDGATNYNSVGVKNYTSFDQGVQATVATLAGSFYRNIRAGLSAGQASEWDKAGRFAKDLHAWSAGPNAPMSKGYTTVSNVSGDGSAAVAENAQTAARDASGGISLNDFMLANAPELATAMGDPQIRDLLTRYDNGSLSSQQFEAQLEQTSWWKTTPQSERLVLATKATDPATAQQNLEYQQSYIDNIAWSMGVKLTPQIEYNLAVQSIAGGWQDDQTKQAIVAHNKTQYTVNGQFGGQAASDVQQIKSLYSQYALPVDDQTLNGLVQKVLSGKSTVQDLEQGVAQQAATFYSANPQLADFLKSGQGSAQQWASPLISQVSNIMGINPSTIDLTNSQWSWLLKPQTNPQTGQSIGQAQTLDSVEQKIKTDPVFGYSKTANGIADYTQLVGKLQSVFTGGGVS